MKKKKESLPNILQYSTIIKNKWKTLSKLGQGAFGEIYGGIDLHTCNEVAIKVERNDNKNLKMVLKLEVIALKKLQKSNHVVRYLHSGRQDHFNFLIMERLGDNLATLQKRMKNRQFSLCTVVKLGIQVVDCLESIHNLGYIHRDVKPSNFCLGRTKEARNNIYLIDFNLARRYILSTGAIRPPRKHAGFRGTARYASIASHHAKELSRRDDLWSVFYNLVEFATGQLPWKRIKDKKHIGELKERFTNAELVKDLPPEFLLFMQHLQTLNYEDKPDYDYLRSILCRIYTREGYHADAPFDWDIVDEDGSEKTQNGNGKSDEVNEKQENLKIQVKNQSEDSSTLSSDSFNRKRKSGNDVKYQRKKKDDHSSDSKDKDSNHKRIRSNSFKKKREIKDRYEIQRMYMEGKEGKKLGKCCKIL